MQTRTEPLAVDRWWRRVRRDPRWKRAWYWGGPLLVTLLGGLLRFWNLQHPHALMFDETYYVKDAYTLGHLGYEGTWPDDPNPAFEAGNLDTYSDEGSYVVHPPTGKWLIWLGMLAFGPESSFGWRFSTALAGTIGVFALVILTRRLLQSTLLAVVAGGLYAISGLGISMSRTALLDNFLMLFVLLATITLLNDRLDFRRRLAARLDRFKDTAPPERRLWLGPIVWWRPWLLATGVLLGLAASVKWSGLYFLAFFGVYTVLDDLLARARERRIRLWPAGSVVQGAANFVLLVPVAVAVYLASWTGWLRTSGGWGRQWAEDPQNQATGFWSWVPTPLQSLWHYHVEAYSFHVGLTTEHSWSANPLTWPFMIRPTLFYRTQDQPGCGSSQCIETVSSIENPILWWTAWLAALFLAGYLIHKKDWRAGFALLPLAAGYLPWLQYTQRTVFQFYTVVFVPYLILAVVFVLGLIMGRASDPPERRRRGLVAAGVYLGVVALVSVFFYPLWTGQNIPLWYWELHSWLPWTWN